MAKTRIPLDFKEHPYRAKHDLSKPVRTTLHTGLLTPVYFRRVFAGDVVKMKIPQVRINAQSTITPVLGNFRLRHEIVFQPDSNLYGWLDNNDKKSTDFLINVARKNTFKPSFNLQRLNAFTRVSFVDPLYLTNDDLGQSYEVYDLQPFTSHILRSGTSLGIIGESNQFEDGYYVVDNKDFNASDDIKSMVWNVRNGSLFDYIGMPSGFCPSYDNEYCLDYVLTYLDYWRSYHRNLQEKDIPYCKGLTNYQMTDGSYSSPTIASEAFENWAETDFTTSSRPDLLDRLFRDIHHLQNGFSLNLMKEQISLPEYVDTPNFINLSTANQSHAPFLALARYLKVCHKESGGLFPTTYMPDLWRNLLSDEDKPISEVSVSNGTFTIEEFRYKNRLQMIIDRFDISGGRFSNWLSTIWGVKPTRKTDIPQLIGTRTDWFGTTTVTSTAQTTDADLGQMAAKVDQNLTSKSTYSFKAHENGILMVVVSIVPEVDYFQNLAPYLRDTSFLDEFIPQMANKGFEDVPRSDYSGQPLLVRENSAMGEYSEYIASIGLETIGADNSVVGRQVAWLREMTDVSRCHGEFAQNGSFTSWVLGRLYTHRQELPWVEQNTGNVYKLTYDTYDDISTYVNPLDWQYIFKTISLDTPNWYYQAYYDIDAVRPIGRRFMPTLE